MLGKKVFIVFLVLNFTLGVGFGQHRLENGLLLQLEKGTNAGDIVSQIIRNNDIKGKIKIENICSSPINVWNFEFDKRNEDLNDLILYLSTIDGVEKAQLNHDIDLRTLPDDPLFSKQWSLMHTGQSGGNVNADIDVDLAWDYTTGGVTKSGDTIVICIIDSGIDSDHEDLKDNLWINRNEIEDNGIDDDNNGYVDDYRGWNPVLGTDDIEGQSHGTSVAGIIGAKGNNNTGISGINWDVKLLVIPFSGKESEVIEAYSYVYTMRKLYNETNGAKGAFIVATNNSFGLDNAKAKDFPIWCSMYDLMGSVGVISVGATSNSNTNVDVNGDMPSTCPSDFLISVTNIDDNNLKYTSSGFGRINVDLGAYGQGTYSTKSYNGYGAFGGTSAATPHVTGTLGLIYSGGTKVGEYSKTYPVQTGLAVKDAILTGVVHNATLENITVTEGVLNANNSLIELNKYDGNCAPPMLIVSDTVGGDLIEVKWDDFDETLAYTLRYKSKNEDWKIIENVKSPYVLSGLEACDDYYFAIKQDCADGKYGYTTHIKTDGCCTAPKIELSDVSDSNIHLEWDKLLAAEKYRVSYKFWSHPIWNETITSDNYVDLDVKTDCGKYAVSLETICKDSVSNPSKKLLFGDICNECKTNVYCYDKINNGDEWIERFSIDGFTNISGADIEGKGIYTDSKSIKLVEGQTYNVKVDIGYKNTHYNDYIYLWIDMNSDSLFSSDELVATDSTYKKEEVEFNFVMPPVENTGETNLRILLVSQAKDGACGFTDNDYGEYEDYCVVLDKEAGCDVEPVTLDTVNIGAKELSLKWNNPENLPGFYIQVKKKSDTLSNGIERFLSDTDVTFFNLDTCTDYQIYFAPYCSDIERYFQDILNVKTDCNVRVNDIFANNIKIYPNPPGDVLFVEGLDDSKKTKMEIMDLYGRIVFSKEYEKQSLIKIDFDNRILPGFYIIKLKQGNNYFSHKIIKL